jgi:hypothetical protein
MNNLSELEELAIKYCPVIYFSKDEKYMPASFEYLLDKFPIINKQNNQKIKPSVGIKENGECIWSGGPNPGQSPKYFLNIGESQGGDGYLGKPNPNNVLYGDPQSSKRYVHVYTLGEIKNEKTGTTFIDLVYGVYYCWNGTAESHAFDIEEIILRFQKQENDIDGKQFNPIYNDYPKFGGECNKNICGKYFLTRVFLSAHGNGMLYPTGFPNVEGKTTEIEFYKDPKLGQTCRPVIYSALASHAMYPTPGIQKRLFGFGNDFTAKDILWSPNRIALWSPAFILDKTENKLCGKSNVKIGTLSELDVSNKAKIEKPSDSLWLSYFNGVCGNENNNQTTIPFKGSLLNIVSSGDFYYKFQKGGADNMINSVMSNNTQTKIVIICFSITLLTIIYTLFFTYRENNKFQLFIPFVTFIGTITVSIGSLVMFAGGGVAPNTFGRLITEKSFRTLVVVGLSLFILIFYIILPIYFNRRIFTSKSKLKAA